MTRRSFEANKKIKLERDKTYTTKESTPEDLVKDLLALVPFEKNDTVLDAGSGKDKVWFRNIPTNLKDECEIDEGKDFYKYNSNVHWVVGNPPFPEFDGFLFHSAEICLKGFAFLTNHTRLNQLTAKRLGELESKGFYLNKIHIIEIRKWFGRYYFLIFAKQKPCCITYSTKKYGVL